MEENEPKKTQIIDRSKLAPLPPYEDVYDYDSGTLGLVLDLVIE